MGAYRVYRERKYAFGQQLLILRTRAGLTQIALAEQIGVNRRSVLNWETGESYPKAETLQRLIAVFLAHGMFTPGQEAEQAAQLWEQASQDAPHVLGAFDVASFARLLAERSSTAAPARAAPTSLAPASAMDRVLSQGLVTFLATDIEGSTKRWEHAPQAMQQALVRHHAIVQQLIELYGGQVFHTAGDSFICVFADAAAALQSALAIQRALLAEPWPEAVAPLRVRMTLHSGAATMHGERYVAEPTLNRLSRVLALTQGGQILLTQSTIDLLGARWPEGVTRRDLGVQQLRDVTMPLQLWQVLAPDLPADVPPLRGIDDRPQQPIHNLPAAMADFIGRETDHTLVLGQLRDPTCRLVTLVGLGGAGKTTLALHVAQSLLPDIVRQIIFPHGAFFVSLAGIEAPASDPGAGEARTYNLLATAIAGTLQLTFSGAEPPHMQLANVLREKHLLLIIDNCEHLPAAAGFIADLLRQAPDLTILATSRTRLNLRGEHIVELSGLSVPPASGTLANTPNSMLAPPTAGDEMMAFSALQLFRARARATNPHFTWTPENAAAAARICRLFDGLPLGIELAAQMVRLLPCPEIVCELEMSLDALATSQQDMPARHRSLRVVFDHSWRLLAEDTQRTLRQLSVFRGGFSRDGAAQVAAATLPLLATLLDASLVRLVREGRAARYEMQEVVRQYAAERLAADESGAHSIRTRHSHYYLGLLERAARELRRADQQDMLASIQTEIDNVRIAWQWAADQGDAQGLVAASDGLFLFYEMRSWFQEGAEAFGQAAERFAEAAADKLDPTAQQAYAKLLACTGWFTFHLGQQQRARAMLGQSLDLMRDLGDPAALVFPLNYLAAVTYHGGAYDEARLLAMEALAASRTCGDQDGVAVAQTILGQIAYLVGDYRAARVHSEASLALERALGNRWGTVFTLISLGRVALAKQAFAEARHWFSEGLAIREALGDGRGIGLCLRYLGDIVAALGDHGEAQRAYHESLACFKVIGDQAGAATSLIKLGYNALALHQPPAARSSFFEALRAAWAIRANPETLEALAGIATVLAEDNPSQAYALATLVARHPAVTQESKDRAETLQTHLVSTGFGPTSAALPDQNTVFALDPIVAALLGTA